jgi:aspartate ammonia-lyase
LSRQHHPGFRAEHDLLGDREVPADVYYGVHTARALENFLITGVPISRHGDLVVALASVKQAAAEANQQLGQLDTEIAEAIIASCIEIRGGSLHEQFVVDQIQGGAGASTNVNANEVIANRALEILGHDRGAYHIVHPLEHVNAGRAPMTSIRPP